jgi:hypothetical protein
VILQVLAATRIASGVIRATSENDEARVRHKHRGLDGQTPTSVFTAIEADALMPLPPQGGELRDGGWGIT